METIILADEAVKARDFIKHNKPKDFTDHPAYDAWLVFLIDCVKETALDSAPRPRDDPRRLPRCLLGAGNDVSSVLATKRLVEHGVPPERIIGVFVLLFQQPHEVTP